MRVLLIEDNALLRALLSETLGDEGIEVDALSNAEDALILLGAGQVPDVLVADLNLGQGLNGLELADIARDRHPDVEVILISGTGEADMGTRLRPRPHERLLRKPFPPEALARAIREAGGAAARGPDLDP